MPGRSARVIAKYLYPALICRPSGNVIEGSTSHGLALYATNDSVVAGNIIKGDSNGLWIEGDNNLISRNQTSNNNLTLM